MKHLENEKLRSFCRRQSSCAACDMEGVCWYLAQEFEESHSDDVVFSEGVDIDVSEFDESPEYPWTDEFPAWQAKLYGMR